MTVAVAERQATDATREQRRTALIELAELIDGEDRHPGSAPFTPVLGRMVPALASRLCLDPLAYFNGLVAAVAELRAFTSNEGEWLIAHDLCDTAEARANQSQGLRADVDLWADRLMRAPAQAMTR